MLGNVFFSTLPSIDVVLFLMRNWIEFSLTGLQSTRLNRSLINFPDPDCFFQCL